jgi:hypothetical protein
MGEGGEKVGEGRSGRMERGQSRGKGRRQGKIEDYERARENGENKAGGSL